MKPSVFIMLAAVGIFGIVIFQSNERPKLLPGLAGCYRIPGAKVESGIRITTSGELHSGKIKTLVQINIDKLGLSFLPERKVVIDPRNRDRATIDYGYPILIRINSNRQSLMLPDENGKDIQFDRVPCS